MRRALFLAAVCSAASCSRTSAPAFAPTAIPSAPALTPSHPVEPPLVDGTADMGVPGLLPLIEQRLAVTVDGPFATVVDDRWYDNCSDTVLEGKLHIEIDRSARVSAFSYWNGEARVVGEVLPSTTARSIYERTVARNLDPGLLEQLGPGSYGLQVAPIAVGEHKRVQITHEQWLGQRRGEVQLRTPLATPDATIAIALSDARGLGDVTSSTHALATVHVGDRMQITATPLGTPADLTLHWRVPAKAPAMHAFVHRVSSSDGFVVLSVTPGAGDTRRRIAKDVTLVLDESGSMAGEALEQAKRATSAIVRRMQPGDRVNVVRFDDRAEALFGAPRPIDAATVERALTFIERAGNGGGTEIALALTAAVQRQHDDARPKSIVLITDGESPRESALSVMATDEHDLRLFTLGIGRDVDANLLTRLASRARGRYSAIEDARDIERTVAAVYDRMDAPAIVDLELDAAKTSLTRVLPEQLPDLAFGDELVIVGRIEGPVSGDVILHGVTRSGRIELRATLDAAHATGHAWAAAMWARARIDDLLVRIDLDGTHRAEQIEEVTRLGVAHDLVTPYTSFLAIPESELTDVTRGLRASGRRGEISGSIDPRWGGDGSNRDFSSVVEVVPSVAAQGVSLGGVSASPPPHARAPAGCAHCQVAPTSMTSMLAWPCLFLLLRRRASRASRRTRRSGTTPGHRSPHHRSARSTAAARPASARVG